MIGLAEASRGESNSWPRPDSSGVSDGCMHCRCGHFLKDTVPTDGEQHDEGEAWPSSEGSPGCSVALESGSAVQQGRATRKTAEPTTRQR